MKRILSLILVAVFLLGTLCACTTPEPTADGSGYTEPRKFIITDQKNKRIAVYDLNDSDWSTPDWTWSYPEKTFVNPDGVKFRHHAPSGFDVMVMCCSGGFVGMVSYPQGELLAYVENAGGNPHSVEVLPDGALAVAASNGNYVRIYDTSGYGDVSEKYTQVKLEDAHGLLWDPEYEVLWALGRSELVAYEVDEDHKMTRVENLCVSLFSHGGHDLAPVFGNTDLLWASTGANVLQISKSTGTCSILYPGGPSLSAISNVKGIGNFPDGTVVYSRADNVGQEWNTDTVYIGTYNKDENRYYFEERKVPGAEYYKIRIFEKSYLGPETEK